MKKKSEKNREKINFEKHRLVEELHALVRRNFPRRRVIVRGYDDLWQADIVEMRPYSSFNRGHHCILTHRCVEQVHVGRSRARVEMRRLMLIRASGRYSKNLQTDMGKEFYNADMQKNLEKTQC